MCMWLRLVGSCVCRLVGSRISIAAIETFERMPVCVCMCARVRVRMSKCVRICVRRKMQCLATYHNQ